MGVSIFDRPSDYLIGNRYQTVKDVKSFLSNNNHLLRPSHIKKDPRTNQWNAWYDGTLTCYMIYNHTDDLICKVDYYNNNNNNQANATKIDNDQVGGDHYRKHKITPWDVIDEYNLDFYRGTALKYQMRAGEKLSADEVEDIEKAIHYLRAYLHKKHSIKTEYKRV